MSGNTYAYCEVISGFLHCFHVLVVQRLIVLTGEIKQRFSDTMPVYVWHSLYFRCSTHELLSLLIVFFLFCNIFIVLYFGFM
jgi:hypothetical protein